MSRRKSTLLTFDMQNGNHSSYFNEMNPCTGSTRKTADPCRCSRVQRQSQRRSEAAVELLSALLTPLICRSRVGGNGEVLIRSTTDACGLLFRFGDIPGHPIQSHITAGAGRAVSRVARLLAHLLYRRSHLCYELPRVLSDTEHHDDHLAPDSDKQHGQDEYHRR